MSDSTTMQLRLYFEPVVEAEFEALADLRGQFWPAYMRHIVDNGKRVGLLTLKPEGNALKLQHLYLMPEAQGDGIGTWAIEQVKVKARAQGRDVKLEALEQSDANRFYLRHGFLPVGEEEFDVLYRWPVTQGVVA